MRRTRRRASPPRIRWPQLLNNGARLGGGTAQAGTPAFLPTGAGAVERSAALGDLKTGAAAATIGSLLAGAGGKTTRISA